jgi:hypothetical protein
MAGDADQLKPARAQGSVNASGAASTGRACAFTEATAA